MRNFLHSIAVQLCKYIEHRSLSCAQDGSENKLTHCAKTMLHNKASGETKIFQWMIYLRRNMTLFVFVRHTYIIYICKFDISLIFVFVRWTFWYHRPTFDWSQKKYMMRKIPFWPSWNIFYDVWNSNVRHLCN